MTSQMECTLLMLRQNQQLLLAMKKRGHGVGMWNGVGGKLKTNESVEEALVRECEEEIGVTPTIYHKVAIIDFTFPRDGEVGETVEEKVHVYIADEWQGEPEETGEMAPRWFQISEIPYDHMWEDDALWLPLVLRGRKLQCKFGFGENVTMLSAHLDIVQELAYAKIR